MQLIVEWLLQGLRTAAQTEKKKLWVEERIQLMSKEENRRVFEELKQKNRFTEDSFDDFDREQELLSEIIIHREFKPLREWIERLEFLNLVEIYKQIFSSSTFILQFSPHLPLPDFWKEICEKTVENLDHLRLSYEDSTAYLYLKEKLAGFETNNSIRHVLIDEAQDYSPFQMAYIKRLFPRSKFTVLGDFNQAIFTPSLDESGFQSLGDLFPNEQTHTYFLKRSYRSTRQIIEFTRGIVAGGEDIEAFNRQGRKPCVSHVMDHANHIKKIMNLLTALSKKDSKTFRSSVKP